MATGPEVTGAAGAAKEQARDVWNEAKDRARSRVDEQQNMVAKGIGDFAGALRQAARNVDDGPVPVSRLTENVADRLERFSGTLRTKDLNTMVRDVESFARSQPLVFFGVAMAAGFFAMRFLRSSTPTDAGAEGAYGGESRDWPRGGDRDAGLGAEAMSRPPEAAELATDPSTGTGDLAGSGARPDTGPRRSDPQRATPNI
jgi:hypothetical protein